MASRRIDARTPRPARAHLLCPRAQRPYSNTTDPFPILCASQPPTTQYQSRSQASMRAPSPVPLARGGAARTRARGSRAPLHPASVTAAAAAAAAPGHIHLVCLPHPLAHHPYPTPLHHILPDFVQFSLAVLSLQCMSGWSGASPGVPGGPRGRLAVACIPRCNSRDPILRNLFRTDVNFFAAPTPLRHRRRSARPAHPLRPVRWMWSHAPHATLPPPILHHPAA